MRWCDRQNVGYILGLAKNSRINKIAELYIIKAEEEYKRTGEKQRLFGEVKYGALPWDRERRVIVKAEHNHISSNPRYVVTNVHGDPQHLYDNVYCARGDMENRMTKNKLAYFLSFVSPYSCKRSFRSLIVCLPRHSWPTNVGKRRLVWVCGYNLLEFSLISQ